MEIRVYSKIKIHCLALVCESAQHKEYASQMALQCVQPNSLCVLYSTDSVKDLDHIFFTCPFASACWIKLGFQWDVSSNLCDRALESTRLPFSMEIFVSATWKIWNLRSSKIFDNGSPTIHLLVKKFKDQVYLQLVRVR